MATQPSSFRSLSDVDRELAAMSQSLEQLVQTTDALQKTAAEHLALVDMAVVMTEAHDYAAQTRQDAEAYAQETRAHAEAEAAAVRQATAEACEQAEASARATVERLYTEAHAALSRLQTDYTERRTAFTRVQSDTREAWAAYKAQLATAYATVDQALAEPPPTLPALDTLAALAGPMAPPVSPEFGALAPEPVPTLGEPFEAAPADESPAASPPTVADAVPEPVPMLLEPAPSQPDPLVMAPRLIANPLDPRRSDRSAAAEVPGPLAEPPVADAPQDAVAVPEPAADTAAALDPAVPSLGEVPARPLVVRDQALPTIAEPGFGR